MSSREDRLRDVSHHGVRRAEPSCWLGAESVLSQTARPDVSPSTWCRAEFLISADSPPNQKNRSGVSPRAVIFSQEDEAVSPSAQMRAGFHRRTQCSGRTRGDGLHPSKRGGFPYAGQWAAIQQCSAAHGRRPTQSSWITTTPTRYARRCPRLSYSRPPTPWPLREFEQLVVH
jgi:hypothetical protein